MIELSILNGVSLWGGLTYASASQAMRLGKGWIPFKGLMEVQIRKICCSMMTSGDRNGGS
jgi:hypothetical protein